MSEILLLLLSALIFSESLDFFNFSAIFFQKDFFGFFDGEEAVTSSFLIDFFINGSCRMFFLGSRIKGFVILSAAFFSFSLSKFSVLFSGFFPALDFGSEILFIKFFSLSISSVFLLSISFFTGSFAISFDIFSFFISDSLLLLSASSLTISVSFVAIFFFSVCAAVVATSSFSVLYLSSESLSVWSDIFFISSFSSSSRLLVGLINSSEEV